MSVDNTDNNSFEYKTKNKSFYNTRLNIYFITKGVLNNTNKIKFDMNMIDKNYNKNNFHLIKNADIKQINNLKYDLNKIFTNDTYFEDFKKFFLEPNEKNNAKTSDDVSKINEYNNAKKIFFEKKKIYEKKIYEKKYKIKKNDDDKDNDKDNDKDDDYIKKIKEEKDDLLTNSNKKKGEIKHLKDEFVKIKEKNDQMSELEKKIILKKIETIENVMDEINKKIDLNTEIQEDNTKYKQAKTEYIKAKEKYKTISKFKNIKDNMKNNINYMLDLFFKTGKIITIDNKRYKIFAYKLIHKEAFVYTDVDEYLHIKHIEGEGSNKEIDILNKEELKVKHSFIDEDFVNKESDNKDVNSYNITIELEIVNENETSHYFQKNNCINKKVELKNAFEKFINNIIFQKIDLLTLDEKKMLQKPFEKYKRFNYYTRRENKKDKIIGGFIKKHSIRNINKNKNKNKSLKKNYKITKKTKKKRE